MKFYKSLANFKGILVFGKIVNLIRQIIFAIGQMLIVAHGQKFKEQTSHLVTLTVRERPHHRLLSNVQEVYYLLTLPTYGMWGSLKTCDELAKLIIKDNIPLSFGRSSSIC